VTSPENAISLTLTEPIDVGSDVLKSLYRITGRSTVELRNAIRAGKPIYTAALFGSDHIDVVPRLEKTAHYLDGIGVAFVVHERTDGASEEISVAVMREILEAAADESD